MQAGRLNQSWERFLTGLQHNDVYLTRYAVGASSVVILAGWFAFCMALPATNKVQPVKFRDDTSFSRRDEKADRIVSQVVGNTVPAILIEEAKDPEPAPLIPPVDPPEVVTKPAPVPPLHYLSKEDEQPAKPKPKLERQAKNDVCSRHGMRKQTYYKHKHESWRCVSE